MEKAVFVLGNGESRKGFDINRLIPYGIIIGCNAIFRDFTPDILVAVDKKMVNEISYSGYMGVVDFSNPRGWSAGPTAVDIATHTHRNQINEGGNIFLLGFDLYDIGGKHNNIYKGTENYRGADEKGTNYGNWIFQLTIVFREHPDKKFYRVGRENDPMPEKWKDFDNIKFISYEEMWELLENLISNK